ncbi:MAG: hypothetical protein ACOCUN_01370, partial [Jiangellaceae bacterium]
VLDESGAGGGADEDPFIGVPQDFTREPSAEDQRRYGWRTFQGQADGAPDREPLYRESDARAPYGWSESRIARLQDSLVEANLLEGEFARGWFDGPTRQAYASALGFANSRTQDVVVTLDQLAQQREQQRQEDIERSVTAFQPDVPLPPDRASLRQRARETLIQSGRRSWQIDEDEIAEMVDVLSGEFKRARRVEEERQRRQHEAQVRAETAPPGQDVAEADLSDLEQVDPLARFDEWFQDEYGEETEAREQREEAAPTITGFADILRAGAQQVRGGG